MDISGGKIYNTHIISIVKGQAGTPGELQGIIDYKNSQPIGTISKTVTMAYMEQSMLQYVKDTTFSL